MKNAIKFAAALSGAVLICLTGCKGPALPAEITAFSFEMKDNSSVANFSNTVTGSIDNENGLIKVYLPVDLYESADDRKLLKATVETPEDSTVVTNLASIDFSKSPVSVAVSNIDGDSKNYVVIIEPVHNKVSNGDILFTEYFTAGTYNFKGTNNQFIEITNLTDNNIDLASVQLTRHAWKYGYRHEELDQSVTLSGILPPHGIYVLYCQRLNSNLFKNKSATEQYVSDSAFNSIISTSGNDGFELSCDGTVLDVIGPNEGIGAEWNWGVAKKLQRKSTVTSYTGWKTSEWIASKGNGNYAQGDTAGFKTTEYDADSKNILYFALERLDSILYADVDETNHVVEFTVANGTNLLQIPTVSTSGTIIQFSYDSETFEELISDETEIDFSQPVVFRTFDANEDYQDYTLSVVPDETYTLMNSIPEDGDVVVIYYPASGSEFVLSTSVNGKKLYGESCTLKDNSISFASGMARLTVSVTEEGYYVFKCDGKYLTCPAAGGGVSFADAESDYSLWTIEPLGDCYTIKNVNAVSNSKVQALEYYSGFTTYGEGTGSAYKFKFLKKQ